jgi:hypothetical protein
MSHEELILKLTLGKVIQFKTDRKNYYGHVLGFVYNPSYNLETAIVVQKYDVEVLVDLEDILI